MRKSKSSQHSSTDNANEIAPVAATTAFVIHWPQFEKKKKICLYRVADKTLYLSLLLIAVSNFQDKYKETTKTDILTLQMKTLKHPKGEEELQKLRGKSHVLRVGKV